MTSPCPCLPVRHPTLFHRLFSQGRNQGGRWEVFSQGPQGMGAAGRPRPGRWTAHGTETATASLSPAAFLSKGPDLSLQNYPKQQADWKGLGSQPDTTEGRRISGLSSCGEGHHPGKSQSVVWTVWSTRGCGGHRVHPVSRPHHSLPGSFPTTALPSFGKGGRPGEGSLTQGPPCLSLA